MAGQSSKPTFFWQGVLILVPVMLLAIGSLASLRWDEQSAERDARQKAAQSVQSLAQVIPYTVNDEIQRFLTLQNIWTTSLFSNSEPAAVAIADRQMIPYITKWEQDYPGLKLADLATRYSEVLEDGREIDPPDTPVAPLPPKWFRELTLEQRELWGKLRQKVDDDEDFRAADKAFVESGVSNDARQAAANLEQRLRSHSLTDASAFSTAEYSETGVSFRGIALERMLHDPALLLSNSVQQALRNEIIQEPSFIAQTLLQMAEAKTNVANGAICGSLRRTRQIWEMQEREREWLSPLRHGPALQDKRQPGTYWACWTSGSTGEALAFGGGSMPWKNGRSDLEGVPYSGNFQGILFVPRKVIEAILTKALAKNAFLIPDFAQTALSIEGEQIIVPPKNAYSSHEVLGSANGTFSISVSPAAAKFEMTSYLYSRNQMLSLERRRASLFGLLIVGAFATALVGFVSARRAFHTQLQLSDAKSNFVSSVSHELRAPIASVRLMAESLERGKVQESQKQNQYFQFIVQECRRLTSLIENVLDFSRIEQGRKQYEFEPTDLAALVHETVKLMEPHAAEKGVRLIVSSPSPPRSGGEGWGEVVLRDQGENSTLHTPNSELELDGRAIQQALVNLIDNAIKHSPKGSLVKVEFEWNDEWARLWVEDEGPGIPLEEHEKIFERFYRLGSELRRETQGVGIGLSIVKHIVEAHGGHVTVRSNPGHGSRFTIELPAINAKTPGGGDAKGL